MSCECKNMCSRFSGYSGFPKYENGYRYCTVCEYSILCDALLCPCCHSTLRRSARHKTKFHV